MTGKRTKGQRGRQPCVGPFYACRFGHSSFRPCLLVPVVVVCYSSMERTTVPDPSLLKTCQLLELRGEMDFMFKNNYRIAGPEQQASDRREKDTNEDERRHHSLWGEDGLPGLQALLLESRIYLKSREQTAGSINRVLPNFSYFFRFNVSSCLVWCLLMRTGRKNEGEGRRVHFILQDDQS